MRNLYGDKLNDGRKVFRKNKVVISQELVESFI